MCDDDRSLLEQVFRCIDNTTLKGTDNDLSVRQFCEHTLQLHTQRTGTVAAVCVYPRFVHTAKQTLEGSDIKVASVAGAFPHGQLPIELKLKEVRYAVEAGADEVDIVISRGLIIAGDYTQAGDEIALMREACKAQKLKVIIETGELDAERIRMASQVAIDAGADFIKTSTGKIGVGATLEAAEVMLGVVAENVKKNNKYVGFKAAGGISTPAEALEYAKLAKKIMGEEYVKNQTFRLGASRLTDSLFSFLTL